MEDKGKRGDAKDILNEGTVKKSASPLLFAVPKGRGNPGCVEQKGKKAFLPDRIDTEETPGG